MTPRCGDIFQRRGIAGQWQAFCACGWVLTVPRQNALARAAKIKAAIRKHLQQIG